ncbi:hypothetical protein H6G90_25330 [Nostoc sp. FACHB-145]|nr:hypothetical protein [Nostoc sp. FACHB-145]
MKYFAQAIENERIALENMEEVTTADLLKARAFSFAHAGQDARAISNLRALVSQRNHATPRNLNKLSQVLIRTNQNSAFEEAISISEAVLSQSNLPEAEVWFANHNYAAALIGLGRFPEALQAANNALAARQDERTTILKDIAERGPDILESLMDQGISPARLAEFTSTDSSEEDGINTLRSSLISVMRSEL